ncbi:MAG: ABC transporter ATP-binding protein, partial [Oscillospiraceae bacterium]|nr:ABC transporter ATP-binding protein [Oscillospiraceae bacterium]
DEGTIFVRGEEARIASPRDAGRLGIGMVHQHFKLVDVFTAYENIILGTPRVKGEKPAECRARLEGLCKEYRLSLNLDKRVHDMSVGEKQTVEIMKLLYRGADILVLDEPTAVLTPQEVGRLFSMLSRMKKSGRAVVIITHKLYEVLTISDKVAVLRRGQCVAEVVTAETDYRSLTNLMVGRPVELKIDRPAAEKEPDVLELARVSVKDGEGNFAIKDISFNLRGGEILGVAGVAGSGQKELCEAIAGLLPVETGAILYRGRNIVGSSPAEIIKKGISMSFIPEDRLGMGLVASMDLTHNMLLKSYRDGKSPLLAKVPAKALAEELVERLEISTPSVSTPVRQLSGGNVQKVLLGREISAQPQVLITAYPVRGLDIHSSFTIYALLNEQKQKGVAVLFVGEDLDVLLELSDRILVLCQGELMGVVDARDVTKEQLGLLMTGQREGA